MRSRVAAQVRIYRRGVVTMADGMTEEEIEACRLAFEKFDADGSGTIEANELKVTLQSMGQNPTDEEIFEMLSSVDEDGSGRCAAAPIPPPRRPLRSIVAEKRPAVAGSRAGLRRGRLCG